MSKKENDIIERVNSNLKQFLKENDTICVRFPIYSTKSEVITITIERHKDGAKCATPNKQ